MILLAEIHELIWVCQIQEMWNVKGWVWEILTSLLCQSCFNSMVFFLLISARFYNKVKIRNRKTHNGVIGVINTKLYYFTLFSVFFYKSVLFYFIFTASCDLFLMSFFILLSFGLCHRGFETVFVLCGTDDRFPQIYKQNYKRNPAVCKELLSPIQTFSQWV